MRVGFISEGNFFKFLNIGWETNDWKNLYLTVVSLNKFYDELLKIKPLISDLIVNNKLKTVAIKPSEIRGCFKICSSLLVY